MCVHVCLSVYVCQMYAETYERWCRHQTCWDWSSRIVSYQPTRDSIRAVLSTSEPSFWLPIITIK